MVGIVLRQINTNKETMRNPCLHNVTVILDWDGLAFDTVPLHMEYLNPRYGICTNLDDFMEHPSLEILVHKYLRLQSVAENKLPTREDVYYDLAVNFLESRAWHNKAKPIDGFLEILPILASHANVFIVSARHEGSIPVMWETLERYSVHRYINDIRCVWKHTQDKEFVGVFKREIILSIKGTPLGFFDDSPREVSKVQDIIPGYLFDPKLLHREKEIPNFFEDLHQIPMLLNFC